MIFNHSVFRRFHSFPFSFLYKIGYLLLQIAKFLSKNNEKFKAV